MNEHMKQDTPVTPQAESELLVLVKKIQQQLAFLEKKIDTLIKQPPSSTERPFQKRRFSKPFQPGGFKHPHHRNQGEQGNQNRGFSRGRKAFFRQRSLTHQNST